MNCKNAWEFPLYDGMMATKHAFPIAILRSKACIGAYKTSVLHTALLVYKESFSLLHFLFSMSTCRVGLITILVCLICSSILASKKKKFRSKFLGKNALKEKEMTDIFAPRMYNTVYTFNPQ